MKPFWPNASANIPTGAQTGAQAGADPAWMTYVPDGVRDLVRSHLPQDVRPRRAPATDVNFRSGSFSNAAGTRPYRLYVPKAYRGEPMPMVVMLHGCKQSPEDFAAGTGMNAAAERAGWLVVYPGQPVQAHAHKCWKWFSAPDQQRDSGEPSLIAGITRAVMRDYAVDPKRVFVAGLSAGGAAASIMGATYPELYAAIGVHSGLACGSAQSLPAALAAMERGANGTPSARGRRVVPAIVFHGERDATVSPRNGDAVITQSTGNAGLQRTVQPRGPVGGRDCTRTLFTDARGDVVTEQWLIHGAGHAWSGGKAEGSYTDPLGPDATAEMLRFFTAHPLA